MRDPKRDQRLLLAGGLPAPEIVGRKRWAEFYGIPLTSARTVDDLSPYERMAADCYLIALSQCGPPPGNAAQTGGEPDQDELAKLWSGPGPDDLERLQSL